jgi:hypothetical protein
MHSISLKVSVQALDFMAHPVYIYTYIPVDSECHTKHINTLCGQSAGYFNVNAGGTYSNHYASRGQCSSRYVISVRLLCSPYQESRVRDGKHFISRQAFGFPLVEEPGVSWVK